MGRKKHHQVDFPDRNITAPDSDDGQSAQDHYSTLPIDEEDREREGPKICDESIHPTKVVTSRYDHTEDGVKLPPMPIMNPEDLVGRTFLLDQREDGQKFRAKIVEAVNDHEDKVQSNPELLRFRCSINNDEFEEIMAYNDIVHHIYVDQDSDVVWQFKDIISHEGPLYPKSSKLQRVQVQCPSQMGE